VRFLFFKAVLDLFLNFKYIKLYDKKEILPIALILIIAAIGVYFYPLLPDLMPGVLTAK